MYNTDMMGVFHEDTEHPPSNKENTELAEDKPPSNKEARKSVQPDGSSGLSSGTVCGNSVRDSISRRMQLVYIHLAPGYKPGLGYHNSTQIY